MKQHKHYEIAYKAHYYTSFSPEKRAKNECIDFENNVKELERLNVTQKYIDKYERLWVDWMNAKSRCLSPMITGPSKFPTARNQKANNSERNKGEACLNYFDKIVKRAKQEAYYRDNPHARPIMSDDNDAIERLQVKLEACKKNQETMKAVNKILRKKPLDITALNDLIGEANAKEILKPDCFGGIGFASFELNNNRAKIKRLEERIKEIESQKNNDNKEFEINGVKVLHNTIDMRIQLFFDDKPSEKIRKILKSNAFKWAPSKNAWQRKLTNNAIHSLNYRILPELKTMEN